jgi:hypothetical protein
MMHKPTLKRQNGGNVLKKAKKKVVKGVMGPIIRKMAGKASSILRKTIDKKVKNKAVRGLMHNQLKAVTPYMTSLVMDSIQGGGRRRNFGFKLLKEEMGKFVNDVKKQAGGRRRRRRKQRGGTIAKGLGPPPFLGMSKGTVWV